jgi:predicted SAM-dependent methyltransferase
MLFHPRNHLNPHLVTALDMVRFELQQLSGRARQKGRLDLGGRKYLQLGSGDTRIPGFVNSDGFHNRDAETHIDARYPLPLPDECLKGVYTHHLVEHLYYADAWALFRECHRVLEAGGVMRIVVPDAGRFMQLYANPDPDVRSIVFEIKVVPSVVELPIEAVDDVFRDTELNRHASAWDLESLQHRLHQAGFDRVEEVSVNASSDPMLAGYDNPDWAAHSLYVEAIK